ARHEGTSDSPSVSDPSHAACERALGYLQLGMPEDAIAEIDELEHPHSAALHLKVSALFQLEDWQAAAAICVPMTEEEPADPSWWIQAAYARRRSASIG